MKVTNNKKTRKVRRSRVNQVKGNEGQQKKTGQVNSKNPGIFLIQDNEELIEMNEQTYESEKLLQKWLAEYTALLVGNQIDTKEPKRFLLIEQECGVPARSAGVDRWSIDHLFIDQDAIPTIVEVKRSSDTRIRRQVVGQMLDYA